MFNPFMLLGGCSGWTAYTVTRLYEGFRHPDWMAPESTVRGRENDSLVRPGYIHPQIPSSSGGYGIFRRSTCEKKMECRSVGSNSPPSDYWYCPLPLDHRYRVLTNTKYKILTTPLTFPAWRNVKYQHGRGTKCSSPMLLFYIPPCRKTFPA